VSRQQQQLVLGCGQAHGLMSARRLKRASLLTAMVYAFFIHVPAAAVFQGSNASLLGHTRATCFGPAVLMWPSCPMVASEGCMLRRVTCTLQATLPWCT
jgi:hypothetical protein